MAEIELYPHHLWQISLVIFYEHIPSLLLVQVANRWVTGASSVRFVWW